MPRRPNNKIRLRCNTCKEFTQSINPIIIKKQKNNRFHIKAVCLICNKFTTKYLNIEQVKLLPDEIKNAPDNTTFTDTIERNGGIFPLLPLIGAIAAEITALASAGGAIGSAVISAKNSGEQKRHHRQLEDIARGNGISNEKVERSMTYRAAPLVRNDRSDLPIEKSITDRAGPLVLNERSDLPVERSMSDDELIHRSIEFLTGKIFSVSI